MPSLALFATTSPQLLSAALAAAPLPPQPTAPLVPLGWSLASQDAAETPPVAGPPPEGEEGEPVNEIVVEGEYGPPAGDPAEQINAESYRLVQAVDAAVIEPVAYAYRDGVPSRSATGLGMWSRTSGSRATP